MANDNLVVWVTDWHVLGYDGSASPDSPQAITPTRATAVVNYINNTLDPIGCFDTGDCKNNYSGHVGIDPNQEWDNYVSIVGDNLTWLPVNAGDTGALYPTLPGNHDELFDAAVDTTTNNDFTDFSAKFWDPPFHWTADWEAPRIRFIAAHSYIHHEGSQPTPGAVDAAGLGHITSNELSWIENEINTLPPRWQAIVCTHFPVNEIFGNNIKYTDDDYNYTASPLNDLMRDHATKVICHFSGHRHANFSMLDQDGVTHITTGGVSYGAGNGFGTFCPISYSPSTRTITIDCRYGSAPYARFVGFTPVTFQLQPHRLFFART